MVTKLAAWSLSALFGLALVAVVWIAVRPDTLQLAPPASERAPPFDETPAPPSPAAAPVVLYTTPAEGSPPPGQQAYGEDVLREERMRDIAREEAARSALDTEVRERSREALANYP